MSIRAVKIDSTGVQVPYRGSTTTAILDFSPAEVETADWGQAPTEQSVRETFRALVDGGAVDEPQNPYQGRIVSCKPDPGSDIVHFFERDNPESGIRQASRWTVVSHKPYTD